MALTPEQEAEARYPPLTEGQRELAKKVMNLNFKERAERVGWNDDKSEQSKLIFAAFTIAAAEQSLISLYKFEDQSKKDKERINELESFVKSIGLMKDEGGESSYDQMKAGYAMGYNKCLERIQNEAENLFNKPTL